MAHQSSPKPRILVIEDGITMRLYYRQVLEEAGYHVEEAVNGLEGVERCMAEAFDLLLIDINMPKMDGYQVIRTLRTEERFWRLPMVTISTEEKDSDVRKAYEAGANFYLTKPVRAQDLADMAQLLIGRGVQ